MAGPEQIAPIGQQPEPVSLGLQTVFWGVLFLCQRMFGLGDVNGKLQKVIERDEREDEYKTYSRTAKPPTAARLARHAERVAAARRLPSRRHDAKGSQVRRGGGHAASH